MYNIKKSIFKLYESLRGARGRNTKLVFSIGTSITVLRKHTYISSFGPYSKTERFQTWCWKRRFQRVCIIPEEEPNPHVLIVGMSGLGKSTLLKSFLANLKSSDIPAILFDAHNEHENIVKELKGRVFNALYEGINIFELNGSTVNERIHELVNLFKDLFILGHVQQTKLSACMQYCYRRHGSVTGSERGLGSYPNISDLINELNIFIKNSKSTSDANTLTRVRERLSLLNNVSFNKNFISMDMLGSSVSSFSLAGLSNSEVRFVYIHELLNRIYNKMHTSEREHGIKFYIIIDEAQFVIDDYSTGTSAIKKFIEEGRKYGLGVIIVMHTASEIPKQIIANTSTFISFYAREPHEIAYASSILAGSDSRKAEHIKERLCGLKQNEVIMTSFRHRDPVQVLTRKPLLDTRNYAQPQNQEPTDNLLLSIARKPIRLNAFYEIIKNKEIADRALARLDAYEADCNGIKEKWVMHHNAALSIEHEVQVRLISEFLEKNRINHKIVDNSSGPDIVAYVHGKRFAIEYETGKKSIRQTADMIKSRQNDFQLVIIVINELAHSFYKNYFEGTKVRVLGATELQDIINLLDNSIKCIA